MSSKFRRMGAPVLRSASSSSYRMGKEITSKVVPGTICTTKEVSSVPHLSHAWSTHRFGHQLGAPGLEHATFDEHVNERALANICGANDVDVLNVGDVLGDRGHATGTRGSLSALGRFRAPGRRSPLKSSETRKRKEKKTSKTNKC